MLYNLYWIRSLTRYLWNAIIFCASPVSVLYPSTYNYYILEWRKYIWNLFTNLPRSSLAEIPLCAVYFGTYEALLRGSLTDSEVRKEFSASRTMISGGLAGTLCWLVGLPADVAKSRFQTALPGRYKHIGSVYLELVSTTYKPHKHPAHSMYTHTHTHTHTQGYPHNAQYNCL